MLGEQPSPPAGHVKCSPSLFMARLVEARTRASPGTDIKGWVWAPSPSVQGRGERGQGALSFQLHPMQRAVITPDLTFPGCVGKKGGLQLLAQCKVNNILPVMLSWGWSLRGGGSVKWGWKTRGYRPC